MEDRVEPGQPLARHPSPSAVRQLLDHSGARPPLFGRPSVPDPYGPVGESDRTRVMADWMMPVPSAAIRASRS
jgi:hypothetical protein